MLFPVPDPALWAEPGEVPFNPWRRRFGRWVGLDPFPTPPAWIEQARACARRRQAEQEDLERFLQEQADHAALMAMYEEQGEHMAERLPIYLHKVGLSYRRKVEDRKMEGRFFERVIYCKIETWYFDEHAYYFKIDTDDLPTGLSIPMFLEEKISDTLSTNFNSHVDIERFVGDHERAGLWVVVEHQAGRGLIPRFVEYAKMFKTMPKTAPPLTFPVGVGMNGKGFYADMDEMVTVLVVGSRGAGKSNIINTILCTWLQRVGPDRLRLFLTDLKGGLEFDDYSGIPHLGGDVDLRMRLDPDGPLEEVRLGQTICTEPYHVIPVLRYMEKEMERRQKIMRGKYRKISAYNRKEKQKLAHWVLVVDELATLMDSEQSKEAKSALSELARKGRAVGIYIILATQIPDKSVLTRQVAGNMDCRLVGRVADGPSSALSLGDGSWDATRLPFDVPGRMIWRWNDKVIVQTPFIAELTIKSIIARVKGEQAAVTDSEDTAIAEELFTYALDELGGVCSYRDLYARFKARIAQHKIKRVLKAYEASLQEDGSITPVIKLNNHEFYLLPAVLDASGKQSRQLIDTVDFEKEQGQWLSVLQKTPPEPHPKLLAPQTEDFEVEALGQAPRVTPNGNGVNHHNSKTDETGESDEPEPENLPAWLTGEKPAIKLVDEPKLKLPARPAKRQRVAVRGDFPLAVVLDAKGRKVWKQVKEKLGTDDDTQAMNIILNNVEVTE